MSKDDAGKAAEQALEGLLAVWEHEVSGSMPHRVGALGAGLEPDWVKSQVQAVLPSPFDASDESTRRLARPNSWPGFSKLELAGGAA